MTTTAAALAAGSTRFVRIMLIEGVDHAFREGTEADAQAALVGTDWDGLPTWQCAFSVNNRQSAHPWEPFQPGGTATVTVFDDEFGILTHRTAGGAETELTATLDRTETTITVQDTSTFPSSGYIHIGTECVAYESLASSTTFGSVTRGMFSPFHVAPNPSYTRFTHDHRVEPVPYAPNLKPKVTQYPREWEGRWVGIWLHAYDEDGINSKDDALCIFAGRLVEVHDEESGNTTLVIEHVLTDMRDASVGRDQVTATVADGVYLVEGMQFDMFDTTTVRFDADPLVVVASGASGVNEINAGNYTLGDLFNAFNAWWASETAAGNLQGSYTINVAHAGNDLRTKIYWQVPAEGRFRFKLPRLVAAFLGFNNGDLNTLERIEVGPDFDDADEIHHYFQDWPPLRNIIAPGTGGGVANPFEEINVRLEGVGGVFQNQYASLPAAIQPFDDHDLEWGIFLFGDQILVLAAFVDNGDGTYDLKDIAPLGETYASLSDSNDAALQALSKRIDDPTPINVRQVFMFEMTRAEFIKKLLFSTGTAGFNHTTLDALPYGCGLGLPGGLLSTYLATTADNMPGADKAIGVIIDKPTKISDLLGSDLLLSHTFFVWQSGNLQMRTWQTPSAGLAVASLTESNKAEPAGNKISQRSTTVLSDQWSKKVIKIRYNRSITGNGDEYKSSWPPIEDRTAIDNSGDRGDVFTINARNTYTELAGNGAGIEDIIPNVFIPPLTLFTRSARTLRRSIAVTQYESIVPGDIVTVSDEFARDPVTGRRRIVNRPATVVAITTDYGGKQADGSVAPMVGEVTLYLIDLNRIYEYAPSAKLSSYNSGTKTITLATHEYSESSETTDPERFAATYAIRITEIDPEDPSTALTWTRAIVSRSTNDIVHDGVALASFDAAKSYRVTFDTYSAAVTEQQDKAFQADNTDGLIEDEVNANMFGVAVSPIAATESEHTDLGEFHADVDIGDGKAYDVGSLKGFTRLVDNLIDHKTAIQNPTLGALMENADYSGGLGYKLVSIEPIYLTGGITTNSILRILRTAPIIRSSDGSEVSVRVTLSRGIPTDDTVEDVNRGSVYADATFTTSSTSWVTPDAEPLQVSVKGSNNYAWILIECSYKAQTLGIAYCHESERTAV